MAEKLNFDKVVKFLQTVFAGKNIGYFLPESLSTPLAVRVGLPQGNDKDVIINVLREWKERMGPASNIGLLKKEILQSFESCKTISAELGLNDSDEIILPLPSNPFFGQRSTFTSLKIGFKEAIKESNLLELPEDLSAQKILEITLSLIDKYIGSSSSIPLEVVHLCKLLSTRDERTVCIGTLLKALNSLKKSDPTEEISKIRLDTLLILLDKFGIIRICDDYKSIEIHPEIQDSLELNMELAISLLKSDFISNTGKEDVQSLVPLWNGVISNNQELIMSVAHRATQIAYKLVENSLLHEVEDFCIKTYQLFVKLLTEENEETLNIEHCWALSIEKRGRHQEALNKFEGVLSKKKQFLGDRNDSTLETQYEMAFIHWELEDFENALQLGEQVYKLRTEILGHDHSRTIRSMHNLALVHRDQGNSEEAFKLLSHVLEWQTKNLGDSHRSTLITKHNIAVCICNQRSYQEAKNRFSSLLTLELEALGELNAMTLRTRAWYGFTCFSHGQVEEGKKEMEDTLEKQKQLLGEHHPDTKWTTGKLGLM